MFKVNMKSILISVGIVCAFGVTSAQSAELKVGYVDIKTALESTAEYKQGMKRLKALSDKKLKSLKALKGKIDQGEKDLMGQSLAMSQENLSQRQQKLKEMGKTFQRMQQDAQEELSAEKNRLDLASMSKFQKVITAYGKSHHFDLIIPRPVFIYADPKHDITGDIIKLLDAQK
ncbi:MAG: OmpH family outer membrane protein [Mariprofundus sp.]